jgi:hypothetical protein
MRNGQNKRMRGRNNNNRKGQNPLTRVYESNGPDVKIRGTASHVAEKYVQLARDAQSSGDPVAAENYFQHAEHYFRLIAAVQEQFRQNNPYYREGEGRDPNGYDQQDDDGGEQDAIAGGEPYMPREQQPYPPREQPYGQQRDSQREPQREPQREQQRDSQREQSYQPREQRYPPREQQQPFPPRSQPQGDEAEDVERLPAFVTGGAQPNAPAQPANGQNGYETGGPDRFPMHRRRRRRHGAPRENAPGGEGEVPPTTPSE